MVGQCPSIEIHWGAPLMRPSDFYTIGDVLVKRPEYADPGGVSDCPSGQGPWEVVGFTDGAQRGRVGNWCFLELGKNQQANIRKESGETKNMSNSDNNDGMLTALQRSMSARVPTSSGEMRIPYGEDQID